MKIVTPAIILIFVSVASVSADSRSVTFFSDGAMIEIERTAVKGTAEIALPDSLLEGTLRIKPVAGAVIQQVEILPHRQEVKEEAELENLTEQKNRLEDRLKALATREDIFKSAAKSQGGKAPRKTKANPDPMKSIRQGTDFAIAQLEAVYTARRKAELEIRRLNSKIAALRKTGMGAPERIARVTVSPKNGRCRIVFAVTGQVWTPHYDIRLISAGNSQVTLYGHVPNSFAGYLLNVSSGRLADYTPGIRSIPATASQRAKLAEYRLPIEEEFFGSGLRTSYAFLIKNSSGANLPAGEAVLFRNGEYIRNFRFEGVSSGRMIKVRSDQ